jgi:L-fuculose-phosphate aldolase
MDDTERQIRQSIIDACRAMNASGINQGTSGNISVRHGDVMLVTPSATPYDAMTPEMIAAMPLEGEYGAWTGPLKPSTEWRFHLDILRARPEFGAIVHAHPTYCTSLAVCRKSIPAVHYMIAAFGGMDVRCSDYATYGTAELSAHALKALEGRNACLLANHGAIAAHSSLDKAMWLMVELETIARQYFNSILIGGAHLLNETQIEDTKRGFSSYGLQDDHKAVASNDAAPAAPAPKRRGKSSAA